MRFWKEGEFLTYIAINRSDGSPVTTGVRCVIRDLHEGSMYWSGTNWTSSYTEVDMSQDGNGFWYTPAPVISTPSGKGVLRVRFFDTAGNAEIDGGDYHLLPIPAATKGMG